MVTTLCDNCLYYTSCARYRLFKDPIIYCENFKSYPGLNPAQPVPQLKGLCRTCAKRFICTKQKPDTGVWHCEEYQ